MLIKLLKYDLKYMLKNMSVFYILAIFFAILSRLLFLIDDSIIMKIISKISVGCMIAMVVNIWINTMMRSWVRFRDSIYKDEGYLTNTLPLSKNDIYNSKFLQTLIFLIIGFIVIIITIFITYYTPARWLLLKNYVNEFTESINFNIIYFVISLILILFLETFNGIQSGFLGIILGYNRNNSKIGYSVLFGFIAYNISQIIALISIFIVALFNNNLMDLFKATSQVQSINPSSFKLLTILTIVVYTLIITIMNVICKKVFNKGVNIE